LRVPPPTGVPGAFGLPMGEVLPVVGAGGAPPPSPEDEPSSDEQPVASTRAEASSGRRNTMTQYDDR
jgi:hypothetical protein